MGDLSVGLNFAIGIRKGDLVGIIVKNHRQKDIKFTIGFIQRIISDIPRAESPLPQWSALSNLVKSKEIHITSSQKGRGMNKNTYHEKNNLYLNNIDTCEKINKQKLNYETQKINKSIRNN